MSHTVDNVLAVPGFPYCGTITITYYFPNGRQEVRSSSCGFRPVSIQAVDSLSRGEKNLVANLQLLKSLASAVAPLA